MNHKVAIIGGGPAGASCAIELAKHGIFPSIFDHSHPREKPCGGGISSEVIKQFPFLKSLCLEGLAFSDFRLISYNDIQVLTGKHEYGFCVSRMLFDQGILNIALKKGAKLIPEKVLEVKKVSGGWKIITNEGSHFSEIIVGADGANSIVRRGTVGAISKDNFALTFGYLAAYKDAQATIKLLGEIPGYIWVFPGRNYVNVGIGSELNHGSKLKKLLDSFLQAHYPGINKLSTYAALLPSANTPEFFSIPCCGDNWLLVGDAAGHVDPTTGGGIFYALWGGRLAALAIKNKAIYSYDEMWQKEYGHTLALSAEKKINFYDPVNSTIPILLGLANKTFTLISTK